MELNVSNVRYDFLSSALGLGVTAYVSGWAFAEFRINHAGVYLVSCGAVNRFRIDDTPYLQGDYYAWYPDWGVDSWVRWPVNLDAGLHILQVQLRRETFSCSLQLLPGALVYHLHEYFDRTCKKKGKKNRISWINPR